MIQSGGCLRLALEFLKGMAVSGQLLREELQGNGALELGVFGLVDDTHATAAELLDDPVMRNGLADHDIIHSYSGKFIRRTSS